MRLDLTTLADWPPPPLAVARKENTWGIRCAVCGQITTKNDVIVTRWPGHVRHTGVYGLRCWQKILDGWHAVHHGESVSATT